MPTSNTKKLLFSQSHRLALEPHTDCFFFFREGHIVITILGKKNIKQRRLKKIKTWFGLYSYYRIFCTGWLLEEFAVFSGTQVVKQNEKNYQKKHINYQRLSNPSLHRKKTRSQNAPRTPRWPNMSRKKMLVLV